MLRRSSKNLNFNIKRKYSSTLCVCFLFTRHCLRPRHNARRAVLLPDLQQWHVWCLLQNGGRPDRCNYLPLRHHGGVSDWSHGVSQDVETRSCAQIQGTVRPGGKSYLASMCLLFPNNHPEILCEVWSNVLSTTKTLYFPWPANRLKLNYLLSHRQQQIICQPKYLHTGLQRLRN